MESAVLFKVHLVHFILKGDELNVKDINKKVIRQNTLDWNTATAEEEEDRVSTLWRTGIWEERLDNAITPCENDEGN